MTMTSSARSGSALHADAADKGTLGRYPVFAITFGVVFSIFYLFVMNYSWPLVTYYPAVGQWTLWSHPAVVAAGTPAPGAMKWYGYVATSGVVALVAGLLASAIPANVLRRIWWPGLIWLVPICAMLAVLYLILVVGD